MSDQIKVSSEDIESASRLIDQLTNENRRLKKALQRIVCYGGPMPDVVFGIANNALEANEP
jgi:hypothetical protein